QPLAAVGPDNGAGAAPVAAWDSLAAAAAAAAAASSSSLNIPTVRDAAVTARRILRKTGHATFSTVFPAGDDDDGRRQRRLPAGVAGVPIGLPDYVADCEGAGGRPTVLAVTIGTSFRNAAAGSNVSVALEWRAGGSSSAAALPRFSLLGWLQDLTAEEAAAGSGVAECYARTHPDAVEWFPGRAGGAHKSRWARLVVEDVYFVGGFGDRAYIGWIPVEEWRGVTEKEIEECVLPGE
ncbi:hypothetical protein HK405_012159, partial [Cladochytrium tenue]